MRRFSLALLLPLLALWIHSAAAQSYDGRYEVSDGELGDVEVVMQEQGSNKVSGHIRIDGRNHPFTGTIADAVISGTLQGPEGKLFFEAEFDDDSLIFLASGAAATTSPTTTMFAKFALMRYLNRMRPTRLVFSPHPIRRKQICLARAATADGIRCSAPSRTGNSA